MNNKKAPRYMTLSHDELKEMIKRTNDLLEKDFISDAGKSGIAVTLTKMIEWEESKFGAGHKCSDLHGSSNDKNGNKEFVKSGEAPIEPNPVIGKAKPAPKNAHPTETLLKLQNDCTRLIRQIISSKWYNEPAHGNKVISMLPHINGTYSAPKISPYNLATNMLKISDVIQKDQLKLSIEDVAPSIKNAQKQKAQPLFAMCLYIIEKGLWLEK